MKKNFDGCVSTFGARNAGRVRPGVLALAFLGVAAASPGAMASLTDGIFADNPWRSGPTPPGKDAVVPNGVVGAQDIAGFKTKFIHDMSETRGNVVQFQFKKDRSLADALQTFETFQVAFQVGLDPELLTSLDVVFQGIDAVKAAGLAKKENFTFPVAAGTPSVNVFTETVLRPDALELHLEFDNTGGASNIVFGGISSGTGFVWTNFIVIGEEDPWRMFVSSNGAEIILPSNVPVPPAVWLLGTAVGMLGVRRLRRP